MIIIANIIDGISVEEKKRHAKKKNNFFNRL